LNLVQSLQKRSQWLKILMTDPATCLLSEDKLTRLTQLDANRSLAHDRLAELAAFYQIPEAEAAHIESIENRDALANQFQNTTSDPGLLNDYRRAQQLYVARMMMRYNRFRGAFGLIRYMNSQYQPWRRSQISVLDYGCGVADYGLSFALFGYEVTLCDIAGGNLDFAKWRFEQRSLAYQAIPVSDTLVYPPLGSHRIVLAGELLEHLRDPLTALNHMTQALSAGGYLYLTGYPEDAREVGGDHLPEAALMRDSVLNTLKASYTRMPVKDLPGQLYQKRKSPKLS
jgi:2-polyprenyl-3-methyl-5-hydroxy-6-metoxy-1,4-benzoquinol methylase